MGRARGDRARGVGKVVRSRDGNDPVAVAVGGVEDGAGDIRPALNGTRAGAVIGSVGGLVLQDMEDGRGHVAREGETSQLVVHHGNPLEPVLRVGHTVGEPLHGLDEVATLADDPARAHDVVARAVRHGEVAGGLGLAVDGERAEGFVLRVNLAAAVEDVVRGDVDESDAVLGAGASEKGRAGGVGPPGEDTALRGLGPVDSGVGAAVDDGAVEGPVVPPVRVRVRHVKGVDIAEVEVLHDSALLGELPNGAAQLAVAAGNEGALRGHGDDVFQVRMVQVSLGDSRLLERDGPFDCELGVGEVDERVGPLQLKRPVGVHQVCVGRPVLEGLEGVAHAAGDVDGLRRVERAGEDLPVGGAPLSEVHPRAEDGAAGHGDELVPGLGVDATRDAAEVVIRDIVLDHVEVRDPHRRHLGPLPVLLEPPTGVAVDGEIHHLESLDAGLGDREILLELDVCHSGAPIVM